MHQVPTDNMHHVHIRPDIPLPVFFGTLDMRLVHIDNMDYVIVHLHIYISCLHSCKTDNPSSGLSLYLMYIILFRASFISFFVYYKKITMQTRHSFVVFLFFMGFFFPLFRGFSSFTPFFDNSVIVFLCFFAFFRAFL